MSAGAAAGLVKADVPMAVAMPFPIAVTTASHFTKTFYRFLARGESVEHALGAARILMRSQSETDWAIPRLFSQGQPGPLLALAGPSEGAAAKVDSPARDYKTRREQAQDELKKLFLDK
jgi:hypothetical protein